MLEMLVGFDHAPMLHIFLLCRILLVVCFVLLQEAWFGFSFSARFLFCRSPTITLGAGDVV